MKRSNWDDADIKDMLGTSRSDDEYVLTNYPHFSINREIYDAVDTALRRVRARIMRDERPHFGLQFAIAECEKSKIWATICESQIRVDQLLALFVERQYVELTEPLTSPYMITNAFGLINDGELQTHTAEYHIHEVAQDDKNVRRLVDECMRVHLCFGINYDNHVIISAINASQCVVLMIKMNSIHNL